jgi:hypothetical protein
MGLCKEGKTLEMERDLGLPMWAQWNCRASIKLQAEIWKRPLDD